MLVEQPLVNEGLLLSIIMNYFSDCFFFPHKETRVNSIRLSHIFIIINV